MRLPLPSSWPDLPDASLAPPCYSGECAPENLSHPALRSSLAPERHRSLSCPESPEERAYAPTGARWMRCRPESERNIFLLPRWGWRRDSCLSPAPLKIHAGKPGRSQPPRVLRGNCVESHSEKGLRHGLKQFHQLGADFDQVGKKAVVAH